LGLWATTPISKCLKAHSNVTSVAFSPGGASVISGCKAGTVHIWDAMSGAPIGKPLQGHCGGILSAAFSPASIQIVVCSNCAINQIWDVMSGMPDSEPPRIRSFSVARSVMFSSDNTHIVSSTRGSSNLECGSIALSPDGTRIISDFWDGSVQIWDVAPAPDSSQLHFLLMAVTPSQAPAVG